MIKTVVTDTLIMIVKGIEALIIVPHAMRKKVTVAITVLIEISIVTDLIIADDPDLVQLRGIAQTVTKTKTKKRSPVKTSALTCLCTGSERTRSLKRKNYAVKLLDHKLTR